MNVTGMMKNPRLRNFCALSLMLLAFAAGCGAGAGNVPETRYFVIDYTLKTSRNSGPVIPVSVGVDKFRSDAVYRTDKIVFRKVPYQVEFYPYERWGARPEEIVTDRMIDHLLAINRFREVFRATSGANSDYLVRGRVKRFEEDSSKGYAAVAQIEVSLIYRKSGKVLLQRRVTRRTPAKSKPPQGFVNAMAENLKSLLGEMAGEISKAVVKHRNQ
jgi:ABC-type uncharacterized transport system auxiliary subunit